MFVSSTLLALCLTVPAAHAASGGGLIIGSNDILFRTEHNGHGLPGWDYLTVRTTSGSTPVYGVTAEVESDAGSEEVTLTESDASLHGAAAIAALPSVDSLLTLTLYDTGSASLMSFSGTLGADGSVALTSNDAGCDPSGRATCDPSAAPDIEVLAAEVFVGAAGGSDVAFDLNGADTYDVAYADIVITESTEVTTCEKGGACTTTGSTTTTEAEVDWDTISSVWEGQLTLAHEGVIEIKAKTLDSRGKKIETVKTKLGAAWIDGAGGMNALATDEDPLTSVAWRTLDVDEHKDNARAASSDMLTVVSEGWSTSTAPVSVEVELTNGTTLTVPVNSYQHVSDGSVAPNREALALASTVTVTVDGTSVEFISPGDSTTAADQIICFLEDGKFVCVIMDVDTGFSLTQSSSSPIAPAAPMTLDVAYFDEAETELAGEAAVLDFSTEYSAVFATKVSYAADPIGTDLSGKVSLLGAANKKGKQSTLSAGKFYGTLTRDGDGDVALAGADKDAVGKAASEVSFRESVTDLPAVVLSSSNGGDTLEKHGDILIDGVKIDYD